MEVAVAGAIVALLSACVFRGILTVKDHARATADRIAAQGLCMQRYEEMKSVAWENVDELYFPTTNVLLSSLSKDPTKGRLMAEISNTITNLAMDGVNVAKVDITCRWTFRGRPRSEVLHGYIVDEYSSYAEKGSLSGTLDLNPNFAQPLMFYVRTTDGEVYTQANIHEMPAFLSATTVVVMPGGGGRQNTVSLDGSNKNISNGKTVAFTAAALSDPILLSVSKMTETIPLDDEEGGSTTVTRYTAALSCGNASFSYK